MRIAILETVAMQGGHEVEFDRLIVESLRETGYCPLFFVPQGFRFSIDYNVEAFSLKGGPSISHSNARGLKRIGLSVLRSIRRLLWFSDTIRAIQETHCDAVIIPSATLRFIKSLLHSRLRHSPVPVYVLLHGIEPKEVKQLAYLAKKGFRFTNIEFDLLTLTPYEELKSLKNIRQIPPQVFTPDFSIGTKAIESLHQRPLRLGFFGWYRKEKNLELLLDIFSKASFSRDVKFVVQAVAQGHGAKEELSKLIQKHQGNPKVEFIPKALLGNDWASALISVDAVVLPYAEKWHSHKWSAMLFNALGFRKPVFISKDINPELLKRYPCGMSFPLDDASTLQRQLEDFVNSFEKRLPSYSEALDKINKDFSPNSFIQRVLNNNS